MVFGGSRQQENALIIDEKRQIVLNKRDLNNFQQSLYLRNFFNSYRPDLSTYDYFVFKEKLKLGESYLNELRKRLNDEIRRAAILTPTSSIRENLNHKISDQVIDLNAPHIRGPHFQTMRTWEDASKIVNYVEQKHLRLSKYGLDYPLLNSTNTEESCIEKEEEVYQRLVREMRKAPFKPAAAASEAEE